jgi:hypothetical protein
MRIFSRATDSLSVVANIPKKLRNPPFMQHFTYAWSMKSMTCNQLGGACDLVFTGDHFEDIAGQSQQHGKEMFGASDGPHMAAMGKMMEIMKSGEMDSWMEARRKEFEVL